jgi:hypothetical protein
MDKKTINLMIAALQEALELCDDYEDVVDGPYGGPLPNYAMCVAAIIRETLLLAELRGMK